LVQFRSTLPWRKKKKKKEKSQINPSVREQVSRLKHVYLQPGDNGGSVLVGLGLSAEIASQGLALGESIEDGLLDAGSVLVKTHMSQHHDGAEEEGSGVGKVLASNIGSGTVDSLEDRALITNVSGGGETKTTDQTGAHVGENVTVEVRHDKDLVVVRGGVSDHLEAAVVEELGVELNAGEVLGDLLSDLEEETVGELHDGGLVDDTDLLAANGLGVLESKSEDTLGSLTGDELDALDNTIDNNVLNAGVFTLGVLSDQDGVDVVVGSLVASDGAARSQVGEEVEGSAEGKVKRDMALANGSSERTLEGNLVLLDVLNGSIRDSGLAVLDNRSDINRLPSNGGLGGGEDFLDGLGNLGADTVTLNQADQVVATGILGSVVLGNTVARGRVASVL
jgi:hypothetical protein